MDKDKLDKTKENIGISKLDEGTRKKMFDKFIEGGGRVEDVKAAHKRLLIDREKQRRMRQRAERQLPGNKRVKQPKSKPAEAKQSARSKAAAPREASAMSVAFSMFKLRIKLKFLNVTGFDGYYFDSRFFKRFNNTYKPALMELQILYLEIFRKNPSIGKNITEKLDELKPLYYELIEMVGNLFDKIVADQILEQHVNFPKVPKKTMELKEQFVSLYKKLFALHAYENTIQAAFEKAIDYYDKESKTLDESQFTVKRRMRNAVFVTFHKFFPRLHLLFCFYEGKYRNLLDDDIEEFVGITETEKPGNRQIAKYFDDMAASVEEEEPVEVNEMEKVLDDERLKALRVGLELMSGLDIPRLRKDYDRQHLFENVSDADKVFIAYLLFNEFDREYSFILTTNKIKFRTDFVARTKVDFRTRLNELYDKMRKSTDSLRAYADELGSYEKARKEKPSSSSQYIEYTKRMEVLDKKKTALGKNALAAIREYMLEIDQELKVLLEDMNTTQVFISNPQEELVFDPLIEGEKKLNGKKIYEALYQVYCYSYAFANRLSSGGDLSGDLQFNKEELEQMRKQSQEKAEADKGTKEGKSVLEELDDML